MNAPDDIVEAVLETMKLTMIYCRNYSLNEDADIKQLNELMEAVHEIPGITLRWKSDSLREIKLHLACFNHQKWEGAPDLVRYFENQMESRQT